MTLIDETSGKEIASKKVALAKVWNDGSEGVADVIFDTSSGGIATTAIALA